MKLKTTIILMILGFLIFASLCICKKPSTEGLDTMKTNTHILRRGEYMDDAGYMKSEDGNYHLRIRHGKLTCFVKKKHTRKPKHIWTQLWSMNLEGSKIMLLNDNGIIQFKTSRNSEPITTPMSTGSVTGSSLVLTSYGTLELKSGSNGEGDTLFTYPVKEGFTLNTTDTNVQLLMGNLETDRTNLAKRVLRNMDNYKNDTTVSHGTNAIKNTHRLNPGWTAWFNNNNMGDDTYYNDVSNLAAVSDEITDSSDNVTSYTLNPDISEDVITGGHNTLLKNGRKLRRLQNTLDSKIKVLNQLGDSHVTEKQIHLDSTIYISLVWTVIASSLVYYTFTQ